MLLDLKDWKGDGIIANPGLSRPLLPLLDLVRAFHGPVVGLQQFGDYPSTSRVVPDHEAIGRLAARHLLGLGFKHLVYVLFEENAIERARSDAFTDEARKAGAAASEVQYAQLQHWLSSRPRPLGLWAVNDRNAVDVTTACLDAGLRIPQDVAVLGADDSRIVCEFAEVPLSSVNCNFEEQGWRAADALHRLMEGEVVDTATVHVGPSGVTTRRSTDTVAIPDAAATDALRIIRDRFREPLDIPTIARGVGVSVRRLQKAFREHLGFTMIEELTRVRIQHARTLLADPQRKLDAVALECGFSSRFHLIRAFQRVSAETPAAYRKRVIACLAEAKAD